LPEKGKEVQGTKKECITWHASYLSEVILIASVSGFGLAGKLFFTKLCLIC